MDTIKTWMAKETITVAEDMTVKDACALMQTNNIGAVMIVRDKKAIGIFTERDVVTKIVSRGLSPEKTKISEVMTSEMVTVSSNCRFKEAYELMRTNNIRHLPIVEKGEFTGIVSIRDLLRFKMRAVEAELEDLTKEAAFAKSMLEKNASDQTKILLEENKRLQNLATIDGLTELYNYRFFKDAFMREIARANRYSHKLAILFVDIDHFKHYNDKNGHEQGNVLLKQLSAILRKSIRMTDEIFKVGGLDIVARYGGEEFVIILTETDKNGAYDMAKRLMADVREFPFFNKELQPTGKVTVSIGVSEFPTDATDGDDLIKKADQALYVAKTTGRDKIAG